MTKIANIGARLSSLSTTHLLKDPNDITLFVKARDIDGRIKNAFTSAYDEAKHMKENTL